MKLKGQIKAIEIKKGIFHKSMLWLKIFRDTYMNSYIASQFNLGPLTLEEI